MAFGLRGNPEKIIVLDELDFGWEKEDLYLLTQMYDQGKSAREMAELRISRYSRVNDAVDEITLAIMHLSREDKIVPRKGGVR